MRLVRHDDPLLARVDAIGHVAFGSPGMAVGPSGPPEASHAAASHDPASNRERLRLGQMVTMAAFDDGEAVAYGSLLLDDQSPIAEIVAVGTLPSHRRRGLGAAVTAALVDEGRRRGFGTVWLSAADRHVAALYERLGFEPIGTYVMGGAAPTGSP
jgi:ribosomal protein S18 acetylase RimI-like enzyme